MLGLSVSAGHGLSGPIYRVDQVPDNFKEHFIIRGYRSPRSSFSQCLLSLFDATNETLNFWTHFLSSWYFVWIAFQLAESFDYYSQPYFWPLLLQIIMSCVFPMTSATAHLFNVMSDEARHLCFFLDYSGISLYSYTCAIAFRAYSFPSLILADTGPFVWYRDNFAYIAMFNSIVATALCCYTRFMKQSLCQKVLRLGSFSLPYIFDTAPIIYRLLYCVGEECQLSGTYYLRRQFIVVMISAFLYSSHLPERLLPGSFDIVGHSHQLFHLTSVLAASDSLQGILLDLNERKEHDLQKLEYSLWTMFITVIGNLVVVFYCYICLLRQRTHFKKSP